MGFKAIRTGTAAAEAPPKRVRAPVGAPAPSPPQQVTLVVNTCVADPERMFATAKQVLAQRGMDEETILAKVAANGVVDLGMCVAMLMEESLAALAGATGAEVESVETYLEFIPGIDIETPEPTLD